MKSRVGLVLLLAAIVVPLSGCPKAVPRIQLGIWSFTVTLGSASTTTLALEIGAGGQTQTPNPLPPGFSTFFTPTITWVQNGTAFMMTQNTISGSTTEYVGTVDSATEIVGGTAMQTVGGTLEGTWSATFLN